MYQLPGIIVRKLISIYVQDVVDGDEFRRGVGIFGVKVILRNSIISPDSGSGRDRATNRMNGRRCSIVYNQLCVSQWKTSRLVAFYLTYNVWNRLNKPLLMHEYDLMIHARTCDKSSLNQLYPTCVYTLQYIIYTNTLCT